MAASGAGWKLPACCPLPASPVPACLPRSKYTADDAHCHCCQAAAGVKLKTCQRCGVARYCRWEGGVTACNRLLVFGVCNLC